MKSGRWCGAVGGSQPAGDCRAETLARWKTGMLTPPERVTPFMMAGVFAKSALGFLQAAWRRRG